MATSQPATEANKALRYPIGSPDRDPSPEDRAAHLNAIRTLPETLAAAYQALSPEQLNTPYREGGWTLRQLAHHVADSHLNAFVRTKLALTENWPTIKPYDEKLWAQTADSLGPVEQPLALLVPLHARWSALLDSLDEQSWARGYMHPESGRTTLTQVASLYAWHGRHHTAHALGLRARMGW